MAAVIQRVGAPQAPPITTQAPLVGRGEELARLEAAITRATARCGGTVLLTGEMGIGKTRLAGETVERARTRGCLILSSRASPLDADLPYAPLIAAMGPFLYGLAPERRRELTTGLPELGLLFADLDYARPEPVGDPGLEKTRLFEAVSRLLAHLSETQPAVLLVDDLHWADAATIELLGYVARGVSQHPLLLLLSYRSDFASGPALRRLSAFLQRAGLAEEVALARMSDDSLERLATAVLGGQPESALLSMLRERSSGTPLFAIGLLRGLADREQLHWTGVSWALDPAARTALPGDVSDLIAERFVGLDSLASRILDLLAVSAEATSHQLLLATSGLEDEELCRCIDTLRARGVISEDTGGLDVRFEFTSPMLQEVAYARMSETARRRAHAAIGRALDAQADSTEQTEMLDRIAHHYRAAGSEIEARRALEVLLAAGDRAKKVYANDRAAAHFGAALQLARQPRAAAKPGLLPDLLERLGDAWEQLGEPAAAIEVLREAVAIQQQRGETEPQARLLRKMALIESGLGRFDSAIDCLEGAWNLIDTSVSNAERVNLQLAHITVLRRSGDLAGAAAVVGALSPMPPPGVSPSMVAEADFTAIGALLADGRLETASERAERLLTRNEASRDTLGQRYAHHSLSLVYLSLGDHARGTEHARRARDLASRLGTPPLEVLPRAFLVLGSYMVGRWEEGMREANESLALARRAGRPREKVGLLAFTVILLSARGDLEEAQALLEEGFEAAPAASDRARAELEMGRQFLQLQKSLATGQTPEPGPEFRTYIPTLGRAIYGESLAVAGKSEAALRVVESIRTIEAGESIYPQALALRVAGLAQRAAGIPESAADCLSQAITLFERLGLTFDAARCRLDWAKLPGSDPIQAVEALQAALLAFEHLGARLQVRAAKDALARLGVRAPSKRPRVDGLLSTRELEVARLVAEGLTNAEVADRLTLSVRTVTTHLDRIYSRLGISSRAALAAYVTRRDNAVL